MTCSTDCPCYQSDCNAANCDGSSCVCSSTATPGGLTRDNTPQFIVVTIDDTVSQEDWSSAVLPLLSNSATDAAGCNLRATFFVSNAWTSYHVFQKAYVRGCEIASHGFIDEPKLTLDEWVTTMNVSRSCLSRYAKVPRAEIAGFRAPQREWNSVMFDALAKLGFKYDSSMVNYWELHDAWLWPSTLHYGVPTTMTWVPADKGSLTSSWPTLWEAPLPDLLNSGGASVGATDYDYLVTYPGDAAGFGAALRASFDKHYTTTRSPLIVALHLANMDSSMLAALQDFFAYAAAQPNVYYATMTEVLNWVANPKAAPTISAAGGMPGCLAYKQTMASHVTRATETICDGLDDDGDGEVDEGLTSECAFPDTALGWISFDSCTPCPAVYDINVPCD